jgi:adenylate cyclase
VTTSPTDAPPSQRRLAAILAADVAGYSRLMGLDEEDTLVRLKALLRGLVDPAIAKHRGRTVKTTGDGLLLEFPSVVDAVRCAVEVQRAMAARGAAEPADRRIEFRIGINLGDVIVDGDDLYGDGVNIAARLEGIAEPGGIAISQTVLDHARDKADFAIEDAGEHALKNIAKPVHVYRVVTAEGQRPAVAAARPPASVAPAKPTIAVLPLANMSGEAEQEFFADGITEDIITELSRFRDLFVISRNSAFVYKGKAINIQTVAKELDVQYIVEGSVRKAGNRVRITVQLIDAETDRHVWAERYDRDLKDIFAIQDEVTASIVSTLPGRIEAAIRERVKRKATDNLAAYECVLAGKLHHHRSTPSDNEEALRLLDRAIALDADYAHAHAWKACTLGQTFVNGWSADRPTTFAKIGAELEIALRLDDNDSDVHRILAAVKLLQHDYAKAVYHQDRALILNPNDDLIVVQQGEILTWLGRAEEGIEWIEKAMRLNPYHPERFWGHLGRAFFVARRYEDAVKAFQRIGRPDHTHFAFLAACHAELGDAAAAASDAQDVLKRAADFTVAGHIATQHHKEPGDVEHHRAALIKAGLPR